MSGLTADTTTQNNVEVNITNEQTNAVSVTGSAGTDDQVTITGAITAFGTNGLTLSGVEKLGITDAVTLKSSTLTGQTIEITGASSDVVTISGTTGADTFTSANLTSGGNSSLLVDLAAGADTITLGAMSEAVDLDADAADTITGFTAGAAAADTLSVSAGATLIGSSSGGVDVVLTGASGAKGNTATHEVIGIVDETAADFSDVVAKIGAALTVAGDTTAANAATAIAIDNGTDTRIYLFSDDATNNTTVEESELTHIGTLKAVQVGDLNANDFIA